VRRVSQQLEWLRLRLTELDADKARFLRHVSHELKTAAGCAARGRIAARRRRDRPAEPGAGVPDVTVLDRAQPIEQIVTHPARGSVRSPLT